MANFSSNPSFLLRELLLELRINKRYLKTMAEGYSPNREGIMNFTEEELEESNSEMPVVQQSQKLAEDIFNIDICWDIFQYD